MAEKSRRVSPYYAENNPMRFIDPGGMEIVDPQRKVNTSVTSVQDESGKLYEDAVLLDRDGINVVQDAKKDESHQGQLHWEAGKTKRDYINQTV